MPPAPTDGPPAWYDVEILARYPHDPAAFTQGLVYDGGLLYESTGLRGESTVRIVRLETGAVLRRHDLAARYFGEGLARVDDRLVQLTWQSGEGFVYDRATLAPIGGFAYAGEGWGLAFDGARLVMSDGTARLRFLDPDSYAEIGDVTVRDAGRPVERLNELEVIDGEVFANVWFTDRIARIDPRDGRVAGWIDLSAIRPPEVRGDDVLNGIAWDAAGRRLLVTGKRWPVIYAVRLVPR
ncbi:MAG: glutaminyl-peptide cyclotransferase [Myxococcales bacterium]|nr:glutaminyl-peptide cyclotransferase [Myxococcales bacterium]MCB9553160.1 glutaminyl-peptide cyclotransferase [Myxococcales bacterium]